MVHYTCKCAKKCIIRCCKINRHGSRIFFQGWVDVRFTLGLIRRTSPHVPQWYSICLFVLTTRAIYQLSNGYHLQLLAASVLSRAIPAATRDLDLFGVIRRINTHVPQRDSNPRPKDHHILRRRSKCYAMRASQCSYLGK
jgi:hypothetical protein